MEDVWRVLLVAGLCLNALLGLGYRVYRLTKGGPIADVIGQGILGAVLLAVALSVALGVGWTRWIAFVYGLAFGVVVMPIWTLAVLIPMRPQRLDYAFTGVYWSCLFMVMAAALLA